MIWINEFPVVSVSSSSFRNHGKAETCSKDDCGQSNEFSSAFEHIINRMLDFVWWHGKAQGSECQGLDGSMDAWLYWSFRLRFACMARSKPVPMTILSKAIYIPWLSCTLIGCLSVFGGVGRPKVAIIRVYTDRWIARNFGQCIVGSPTGQGQSLFQRRACPTKCIIRGPGDILSDACTCSVSWDGQSGDCQG